MLNKITGEVKSVVKTHLFKVTSVLWSGRTISSALGIFTNILLARILGLDEFGQFALVMSTSVVIIGLFDPRFWETIVKFLTRYEARDERNESLALLKMSYLATIFGGAISFLVLALLNQVNAIQYIAEEYRILVYPMAIGFFLQTLGFLSLAILRVYDKVGVQAAYQIILAATTLGLYLLSLLVFKSGVSGVVWSYLIASLVSLIFLAIFLTLEVKRKTGFSGKIKNISKDFKEIFRFSVSVKIHGFLKQVRDIEIIILKFFTGDFAVGVYALAVRIINIVNVFFEPIFYAVYPEMTRCFENKNTAKLKKIIKYITIVNPAIVCVMILGFWLTGDFLLTFAIDNNSAFVPVMVLLFSLIPAQAVTWARPLMLSTGEPHKYNKIIIVVIAIRIVLIVALSPLITFNGPPVAYLIANALMAGYFLISAKKIIKGA